jgi:hypothetical protein
MTTKKLCDNCGGTIIAKAFSLDLWDEKLDDNAWTMDLCRECKRKLKVRFK